MKNSAKYDRILDALLKLLEDKNIQNISVSEIAKTAGMGKGSIYYYFPSKQSILEALIERSYQRPIETARALAKQTDISPFTRMAMIFQACDNSSLKFLSPKKDSTPNNAQEASFFRCKYLNHLISELKPELTAIIQQGIALGEISFDHPAALAEIVLIVLAVKFDNAILPSTPEELEETILGLISLLEKGTGNPPGSLNFLITGILSKPSEAD